MLSNIIFFYALLLFSSFLYCFALDTITVNNSLTDDDRADTLVSSGDIFELGFFSLGGSSDGRRYVGIWYRGNPGIVVWVANRDNPILGEGGVFAVDNGQLKVSDGPGHFIWGTDMVAASNSTYLEAKLLDSGNLILFGNHSATIRLWQSFDYPTDTFLWGMKMDQKLQLTSWKSQVDPGKGNFTFKLDDENRYIISNPNLYWRNGESGEFSGTEKMPDQIANFFNLSTEDRASSSVKRFPNNISGYDYNYTRMVMDSGGKIRFWRQNNKTKEWFLQWWEPRDKCSEFNACGKFGSCNSNNERACECLPGFEPTSSEEWNSGDFRAGCTKISTNCGKNDTFLHLTNMNAEKPELPLQFQDEIECKKECLRNCQCQAYSYTQEKGSSRRDPAASRNNCWIWTEILRNLRKDTNGGHDIFFRVAESTARNCEPCGTFVIPYPLSSGSNCGEPMYASFICNNFTGMFSFKAATGTYNVTSISPSTRTFFVQATAVDNCDSRSSIDAIINFNQSMKLSPFTLINVTCDARKGNFSSGSLTKSMSEIEIRWNPPTEPTCIDREDCRDWPYSTCNVTENGERRCLCKTNYRWDPSALNCTRENDYPAPFDGTPTSNGKPFEGTPTGHGKSPLIVGVTIASVIVLSCTIVFIWIWRRKKAEKQESRENIERNAALLYGTEKRVKDLIGSEDFKEEDKKDIDVPFFNLDSILAATDNFSDENKLGRGGFGPVYKGRFPGDKEIAIKRLSSVSGQGLEEFKNEVLLIARLQHRNLVRLLGYCITRDEKILLYEYMPNKSLDSFIFASQDRDLSTVLTWEMRFNIILGVARGLLYLHQDSRLRIVHRDLKTSNILLDEEMNPKISDFGLARMFEGKQTEGSTNRVVGTYGYMSPEYALDGLFSVKSDVFSFGVVVLEILTGKRNTGYFKSEKGSNFLSYAWRLWGEEKALDLMDEKLHESCNANEFMKCVNVALLCVQDDPADRPTMSTVVVLLSSETPNFPTPKQPAFVVGRDFSGATSSSKQETYLDSITSLGGR